MIVKARVFQKDGNRFLIPGYWTSEDDDWKGQSYSAIVCESMMIGVVCGCDAHQEWLDIESSPDGHGTIAHVPYLVTGSGFANGGIDVMLISGPLFDEGMAAAELEDA